MNYQYEGEILKERECTREVLKNEASSETKRSQCFETDILCMPTGTMNEEGQFANIVIKDEGRGQNLNSIQEGNEIVGSHVHGRAQLSESNGFQLTMKYKNKEDLAYDDDQELKETKEDIKHSYVRIGETEEKVIEDCRSLVADFEQPKKYLVIKSSNKTIGSYEFNADNLNVFTGIVEDNPSLAIVLSEFESCHTRNNYEEDAKHEDTMIEEVGRKMLLLENLLEKSESNCEWKPQVNKVLMF